MMDLFTNDERAYLRELRAITTDANGREVLVGLTLEETAEYLEHARSTTESRESVVSADRYLELHNKHEHARCQVLGAEHELRTESPVRH